MTFKRAQDEFVGCHAYGLCSDVHFLAAAGKEFMADLILRPHAARAPSIKAEQAEIVGTEMEKEYRAAMERAQTAYDAIAMELPEEAQYAVPMAFNIHWYFHVNLRSLQWLCELRSQAAGHRSTWRSRRQSRCVTSRWWPRGATCPARRSRRA